MSTQGIILVALVMVMAGIAKIGYDNYQLRKRLDKQLGIVNPRGETFGVRIHRIERALDPEVRGSVANDVTQLVDDVNRQFALVRDGNAKLLQLGDTRHREQLAAIVGDPAMLDKLLNAFEAARQSAMQEKTDQAERLRAEAEKLTGKADTFAREAGQAQADIKATGAFRRTLTGQPESSQQ